MIRLLIVFFTALPEIINLLKSLQNNIDLHLEDQTVKDDLKKINKAFKDKDEKLLKEIFANNDPLGDDWVSNVQQFEGEDKS